MAEFRVSTTRREELVDVTEEVRRAVADAGISEGFAVVFAAHTTAAVTINENADPDVVRDLLAGLEKLAPRNGGWRHVEGNSDAHLKASLVGPSVTIPVVGGRPLLGTWQGVYFCEFDGPRTRRCIVTVAGK